MTYEELKAKLAENNQKLVEMEAMLNDKIELQMKLYRPDHDEVLKLKEQISKIRNRAIVTEDRLKKEFAMQNSPADVGDIIESERRVVRNGGMVEITRIMRVERIMVAAFEKPQLTFYGTYLKRDLTPLAKQSDVPIYQDDITYVRKSTKSKTF